MLEWRPRLIVIVLVLVLVVFALAAGGFANIDLIRDNWEW
jgi:hypothetical protein